MVTCNKCGKNFDVSLSLVAEGEIRIAKCRVCPTNAIYAVCEHCTNLNQIQKNPCPSCHAQNMWEISKMVPV